MAEKISYGKLIIKIAPMLVLVGVIVWSIVDSNRYPDDPSAFDAYGYRLVAGGIVFLISYPLVLFSRRKDRQNAKWHALHFATGISLMVILFLK